MALGAWCRSAEADPLPVDLTWAAPPECPSQSDVMSELERITRVKPGRVVTSIHAEAKIERAPDGRYHLHLRTQREDQTGDTDLDASTCPVLKRGVTLVLALALGDGVDVIDEKSGGNADPDDGQPAPTVETPAPPAKPAVVKPPESTPSKDEPREALRWAPWLAATGTWGLVAKPSLGGELGLAFGERHWETLVQVSVSPPVSRMLTPGIDATFSALEGIVGGCGRAPFGAWSFSACANFEFGVIHGSSQGAFQDGSANAPWYAAGPSVVLSAPIHRALKLRVAGGVAIAFDPPHFAIQSFREVYVVSRVVPSVSVGIAFDTAVR